MASDLFTKTKHAPLLSNIRALMYKKSCPQLTILILLAQYFNTDSWTSHFSR